MSEAISRSRLRHRARRLVGTSLRRSPDFVQRGAATAGAAVITALESTPAGKAAAARVAPKAPKARNKKGRNNRRKAKATSTAPVWVTPPVPTPDGLTFAEVESAFRSWSVDGEPVGHLDAYVADSQMRFLYTWDLVRSDRGACLELGANPYFTTWLLDVYTDLDLTLANYYGARGEATQLHSWLPPGESERVDAQRHCQLFNVEEDVFPYPDDSFDVVLFCEMLEHMLMDPMHTLREIHRVLKPGGALVLTTPNVARIENVLRLVHGANMYDPYSGFGPYGRHNREYTRHELHQLLEFAGFEVESSKTADGHPVDVSHFPAYGRVAPLLEDRKVDLGHYLYVKALATGTPREGLPSFLYRSWPEGAIVDYP